ncbi:MAG TPA: hypothetical protein VJI15_05505 [Candidatus Nanoarchaeia archaeon]|nr:hypothetical protein [Candidatus Nanoarchaeia archaeon]
MMGIQGIELEDLVEEQAETDPSLVEASTKKADRVDRLGNITYGLLVGGLIDYSSGLGAIGIGISRLSASTMNGIVGGAYGRAREYAFRLTGTTKDSHWLRRAAAEIVPFNLLQVPASAAAIALGCLMTEGYVDIEKVQEGAKNLAYISPLVAPVMGLYMDVFRRVCGVRAASQRAYRGNPQQTATIDTVVPS